MSLKLSIVIPTKNRYEYLENLLSALVKDVSKEFEVIIQDNSDDNSDFLLYINSLNDNRISYEHVEEWLSVIDNCDLGVSKAKGNFVCLLGDDDGIIINRSIELINYMEQNQIDSAMINKLNYDWPDVAHSVWKEVSGKLTVPDYKYTNNVINVNAVLKQIINEGGGFGLGDLPRLYQGFVKKSTLDKLKAESGTYFPGPSPDMANAVGLTKFVKKHIYADSPCIISGQGKKSTGGQGSEKKHHGEIKNIGHLPKNTAADWTKEIPFFWSGPTIYSESAQKALELTNRLDLKLNFNYLYAICLLYERGYVDQVKQKNKRK